MLLDRKQRLFLFRLEEFGGADVFWKKEPGNTGKRHGDQTLDDEEPLPSSRRAGLDACEARSEQPTETASKCGTSVESGDTALKRMTRVDERKVERDTRQETAFGETEEKADRQEAAVGPADGCERRDAAPGCSDQRQPGVSADFLEHEVRGKLDDDVADVENSEGGCKSAKGGQC